MATIRHSVTYTVWSEPRRAHVENHRWIDRDRRLTPRGIERILRREQIASAWEPVCADDGNEVDYRPVPANELPRPNVIRVETFVLQ